MHLALTLTRGRRDATTTRHARHRRGRQGRERPPGRPGRYGVGVAHAPSLRDYCARAVRAAAEDAAASASPLTASRVATTVRRPLLHATPQPVSMCLASGTRGNGD